MKDFITAKERLGLPKYSIKENVINILTIIALLAIVMQPR